MKRETVIFDSDQPQPRKPMPTSEVGHAQIFLEKGLRASAHGRSQIHMKAPATPQGLVFRLVYQHPFWQIEKTEER